MMNKPVNLLIVEDNANQRKSLVEVFKLAGYTSEGCGTGEAALQLAEQNDYCAALIDLNLPDISGLDVLKGLKQQTPGMECILITGFASQESAIEAVNLGVFAYFQKPYSVEQLLLAVKQAIEKRSTSTDLLKEKAALSALVNTVNQTIFLMELDGTVIAANKTAADRLKTTPEDLIGKGMDEFIPEALAAQRKESMEQVIRTGEPAIFLDEQRGMIFRSTIYPVKDITGSVIRLAVYAEDVTEKQKADATLRESEEHFRELYENSPAPYQSLDEDGKILEINKAWLKELGYARKAVIGKKFKDLLIEEEKTMFDDCFQSFKEAGEIDDVEYNLICKNQQKITVSFTGQIETDRQGNFQRTHCVFTNITERKQQEERIEAANKELQRLYNAGRQISELLDLNEIHDTLYKLVKESIKCDTLYISAFNEQSKMISAVYGISGGKVVDVSQFPPIPLEPKGQGIQSPVIRSGKPRMINDYLAELKRTGVNYYMDEDGNTVEDEAVIAKEKDITRSALLIPMLLKNQVKGIVQVQSFEKNAYSERDLQFIEALAAQIAVASNNAELFEASLKEIEERKRVEAAIKTKTGQIRIINEMGQALAQTTELYGVYNIAYQYAVELVNRPNFGISLIDQASQTLSTVYYVSDGEEIDVSQLPALPLNKEKLTGRSGAINGRRPVIIDDMEAEIQSSMTAFFFGSDTRPKSAMYVPMAVEGKVIGLVEVQSYKAAAYDDEQSELLGTAANAIGAAIANGRLIQSLNLQTTALNAAANPMVIANRDGNLEWVNPAFCALTGYSQEECLGHNPRDLVRSEMNSESDYKVLWETILAGEVWRGTLINKRKDGSIYTEEQTITPMKNKKGEITQFIGIKQDVTERDMRETELTVLAAISEALRVAETREEMYPLLLDQLITQLKLDGATLEILDKRNNELKIELGRGVWGSVTGNIIPAGKGLSAQVLKEGKPYLNNQADKDPRLFKPALFINCHAAACAPLKVQNEIMGLLWIGSQRELGEKDMRVLTSVADITANAIHRVSLHEQTERKVRQLDSLRSIDQTINSSLDLRLTLGVIVKQAPVIIRMDAIAVLIYNKRTLNLEYAAGNGFITSGFEQQLSVRIGSGLAGKAALERRTVSIENISDYSGEITRRKIFEMEGFLSYYGFPLIVKGEIHGVLEVFHRAPFKADDEWQEIIDALVTQTAIAIDNSGMFLDLQRSNISLTQAYDETIEGWAKALDLRDHETEGHSRRVTNQTLKLAHAMGLKEKEILFITRGALLHDIGKMIISDAVLNKPGKLTDEEWVLMRMHPKIAYDLLFEIKYLRPALDIPYCHHEKWDGSGYPRGLKGEEIPLAARLFAIVDVYDALTSDRPYRKAWTSEKSLAYIREQSGAHFDPRVVEVFINSLNT